MIEIIYNESGKANSTVIVKPPKNIRQIGGPRGRHKIYVEDYVYTFLHSAAFEGECQKRAAVLLGKSEISQDIRYTFISGAVSCEELVFREEGIVFDEDCWEYIYKEIKQYFDNQEIVGWFLGLAGFPLELTPVVEAAHRKYFAGRDKVLFLSEPAEREDVFFAYEQGILQKKEGYYIYYEKNIPMQEYMVCTREKARERNGGIEASVLQKIQEPGFETEGEDGTGSENSRHKETLQEEKPSAESAEQAIQNYRSMLLERKGAPSRKKMSLFLHTAAAAAMVSLCVIGIATMNNYEKMSRVEQALTAISGSAQKEKATEQVQSEGVVVESVPGQIQPEQKEAKEQASANEKQEAKEQATADEQQKPEEQAAADGKQETEEQTSADEQQEAEEQVSADGKREAEEQVSADGKQDAEEGAQAAQEAAVSAQTYLEQGYYEVQPGDKLELICKSIYQTTAMMDKLCEVNQIEDIDKIYAGQKLVLP